MSICFYLHLPLTKGTLFYKLHCETINMGTYFSLLFLLRVSTACLPPSFWCLLCSNMPTKSLQKVSEDLETSCKLFWTMLHVVQLQLTYYSPNRASKVRQLRSGPPRHSTTHSVSSHGSAEIHSQVSWVHPIYPITPYWIPLRYEAFCIYSLQIWGQNVLSVCRPACLSVHPSHLSPWKNPRWFYLFPSSHISTTLVCFKCLFSFYFNQGWVIL